MVFKVISLLSLLAGIVIAAYLYVSHLNSSTSTSANKAGTNSPVNKAGDAVDNFNQQSQQRLQDAQSQYGQ